MLSNEWKCKICGKEWESSIPDMIVFWPNVICNECRDEGIEWAARNAYRERERKRFDDSIQARETEVEAKVFGMSKKRKKR